MHRSFPQYKCCVPTICFSLAVDSNCCGILTETTHIYKDFGLDAKVPFCEWKVSFCSLKGYGFSRDFHEWKWGEGNLTIPPSTPSPLPMLSWRISQPSKANLRVQGKVGAEANAPLYESNSAHRTLGSNSRLIAML